MINYHSNNFTEELQGFMTEVDTLPSVSLDDRAEYIQSELVDAANIECRVYLVTCLAFLKLGEAITASGGHIERLKNDQSDEFAVLESNAQLTEYFKKELGSSAKEVRRRISVAKRVIVPWLTHPEYKEKDITGPGMTKSMYVFAAESTDPVRAVDEALIQRAACGHRFSIGAWSKHCRALSPPILRKSGGELYAKMEPVDPAMEELQDICSRANKLIKGQKIYVLNGHLPMPGNPELVPTQVYLAS